MRAIEAKRKFKRSRRGYDNLPAGLSLYEQQKWIKGEAVKAADGVESRKFGVKFEQWPGRWTYVFCSSIDRRAEFVKELTCKYVLL